VGGRDSNSRNSLVKAREQRLIRVAHEPDLALPRGVLAASRHIRETHEDSNGRIYSTATK
jgi:hypothetical protein